MANKYYGNQQRGIDSGGNNLSVDNIPNIHEVFFGTYSEDQEYIRDSGAENGLTGPNYGTYRASGSFNNVKQLKSDTGDSAVVIEGGEGGEKITLSHATGAGVVIDADGSIFIIPKGRKGVGIGSTSGPLALSGQRLILTSDGGIEMNTNEFRLKTRGDFSIIAGGTLNIKAGNFHQHVSGSYQNYVAGDNVDVTGGIKREVVGGEQRTQISGFYKLDVGDSYTLRAEAKSSFNFTDDVFFISNKNIETNSGESIKSISGTSTTIQSKESMNINSETTLRETSKEAMSFISNETMNIESNGESNYTSASNIKMSASGNYEIGSSGNLKMTSESDLDVYAEGNAYYGSKQRTDIQGESLLQFSSPSIFSETAIVLGGTSDAPSTVDIGSVSGTISVDDVKNASDVEVKATGEIQNQLSTFYEFPLLKDNYLFGTSGARRINYSLPVILKGDEVA